MILMIQKNRVTSGTLLSSTARPVAGARVTGGMARRYEPDLFVALPPGQRPVRSRVARPSCDERANAVPTLSNVARVLVIEDDPVIADEVRRALDAQGHVTEVASTG